MDTELLFFNNFNYLSRLVKNFKLNEIFHEIGLHPGTLYTWKKRNPKVDTANRFAKYFSDRLNISITGQDMLTKDLARELPKSSLQICEPQPKYNHTQDSGEILSSAQNPATEDELLRFLRLEESGDPNRPLMPTTIVNTADLFRLVKLNSQKHHALIQFLKYEVHNVDRSGTEKNLQTNDDPHLRQH